MKACIPGSFDPITIGHEQLIRRASLLFDEVTVLIGYNPNKSGFLTPEERLLLCKEACKSYRNVRVALWDGMITDYCEANGIGVLVKGIRNADDLSYEMSMARYNEDLLPSVETVFLPAPPEMNHISSSGVRTLISFGKSPEKYLSPNVFSLLEALPVFSKE